MIDPELKTELEKINRNLVGIFHKTESFSRAFTRGILAGLGSIIGVALALLAIGWILNIMGVIPAFREESNQLKQILDEIRRIR